MKELFTPYIYILLFFYCFQQSNSQNLELRISISDSIQNPLLKELSFKKTHSNKVTLFSTLDSLRAKFESIGYFNNRLDSVVYKDSICSAHFFLGKSLKKIRVLYDNEFISKKDLFRFTKNVNEDYFETSIENLSNVMNGLVRYFETKGESFTEIRLIKTRIENNLILSNLEIKSSKKRTIDKIIINGYKNFPKSFLKHNLNLEANSIFSSKKIELISKNIKTLPFVSEIKPPEVLFTNDSTYLYLYLKKVKSNRFDGLIGFSSQENNKKLNFNGYLDLELNNILNNGEQISINWKNNGNDRQFFDLAFELPYFFNTPIIPKLGLNIYKQDSSFINSKLDLSIAYLINNRNKISLIYNSENSSNLLENFKTNIIDYKSKLVGIGYNFTILNDSDLFSNKFNIGLSTFLGNRTSKQIKTNQTKINLHTSYLWSLNYRNHIYLNNSSGVLISDNYLTNELYRIGGFNTIRGFNEESIFVSNYSVFNVEYRYNPNNSSYLYTITDIGFINNDLTNTSSNIYSLGVGYSFRTIIGNINLNYALGKLDDNPLNFNNSRIHLKILNFF